MREWLIDPLLIEQVVDLRAGQSHPDQAVAEWLYREQLPERDGACQKIGPDSVGIHEGEVRAEGRSLCVGNQIA